MQQAPKDRRPAMRANPSSGLKGTVQAPADKSVSHRALILGGMAEGVTQITGLLEGEDVLATARCVAALGAEAAQTGPGAWTVRGARWTSPASPLDFGNSGTGARLMMGAAAGYALTAILTGDESLRSRPMERIAGPLRQMGARIGTAEKGRLPATLHGGGLTGIDYRSPVASAQIKSAILLAGLNADGETRVTEPAPSRDHTEQMLALFGAPPRVEGTAVTVQGGARLSGTSIAVPGDPSSVAFLVAAAVLTQDSEITIRGVMTNPLRTEFFAVLQRMGADLEWAAPIGEGADAPADLVVRSSSLAGLLVEEESIPSMIDEVPILAVCAANAFGVTRIEGLAELRVKESDRLDAVAAMLRANGVACETGEDWLEIEGMGERGAPGGGLVETRHDHRIAMSGLVMGLAAENPVAIDDESMIATSYPDFFAHMTALGADIGRGAGGAKTAIPAPEAAANPAAAAPPPPSGDIEFHVSAKAKLTRANVQTGGVARIDGVFEGVLHGRRLVVGPAGHMTGSAFVETARIDGAVDDAIAVSGKLTVGPTGRIAGDMSYGALEAHEGAHLNGRIGVFGAARPAAREDAGSSLVIPPHGDGGGDGE